VASDLSADATRVDARQALEAELADLKLKALKQRAKAVGVSQDALDDADDAGDIRAAVVDLIAAVRSQDAANISLEDKSLLRTEVSEEKPHFGAARSAAATGAGRPHAVTARATTSASILAPRSKHVMLSYQWNHQVQVKRVHDLLTKLGVKCWMDISGGMGADIYDSMAQGMFVCSIVLCAVVCFVSTRLFLTPLCLVLFQGVTNASVVVCFMSQKYQESENCMLEAKYAKQCGVNIVPVMIEGGGWRPSGWVCPQLRPEPLPHAFSAAHF
jgi:hypothetical protein